MVQFQPASPTPRFGNLIELLEFRAAEEPGRPIFRFLVNGEEEAITITSRELHDRACAIAAVLQENGAQGERALLLHAPGLDYIAAFFGCLYAGVIAVPAYPPDPMRLSRSLPRLQAIVHDAELSFALTTDSTLALAGALFDQAPDLKALRWVATDNIEEGMVSRWRPLGVSREAVAFLQYTSGSTSTPKGVELTHANLLHNLELMRQVCRVTPASVLVSWVPPYHDMGLIGFMMEPLYAGSRTILMSPISFLERPIRWLQAISRYRGTTCGGPNFAYDLCVRRLEPHLLETLDLSSLEMVGCAGEPIRAETVERFVDTFAPCGLRRDAFQPFYGLAEASLFVTGARDSGNLKVKEVCRSGLDRDRVLEASSDGRSAVTLVGCGRVMPGDRIVIADPSTLMSCPAGQVGEIWVSSPSVARGYWNRPDETERTFHAFLADSGEGPFLRTGDLGFLDGEELFVTGRLKDLIIIRGANHYAEDIELTVQACNGALRRGCGAAFSIDVDDQERLVLVQEVDTRRTADWDTVIDDIRQALSAHHQLAVDSVVLVKPGSVPKTSSGKIQRHASRLEFLKRNFDVVAQSRAGAFSLGA